APGSASRTRRKEPRTTARRSACRGLYKSLGLRVAPSICASSPGACPGPLREKKKVQIRADEISRIIRDQIQDFGKKVTVAETGTVLSIGDGIARVYGLDKSESGELVEFANGVRGLVLNLEEDNVGIAIMGEYRSIRE